MSASFMSQLEFFLTPMPRPGIELTSVQLHLAFEGPQSRMLYRLSYRGYGFVQITYYGAVDRNEPHLKTEVLEAAFDREQGLPDPAAFSVPLQERILAEMKKNLIITT